MGKQSTGAKCMRRGKASMKNKVLRHFLKHKGNNRKAERKARRKQPGHRRAGMKREEYGGRFSKILQYHPFVPYIRLEKVGDITKGIPIRNIHGRLIDVA